MLYGAIISIIDKYKMYDQSQISQLSLIELFPENFSCIVLANNNLMVII